MIHVVQTATALDSDTERRFVVAVVIPCYGVSRFIMDVLQRIGDEVQRIYVVDDVCPENTGHLVEKASRDKRVTVIYNSENLGVGGATMAGYRAALADGADAIVKIDGDGQMQPELIPRFVGPLKMGSADYTKGNRFYHLEHLREMPCLRAVGNGALSLLTKLSSGYWDVVDPTNGFTCIHARVVAQMPLAKVSQRYFFESDMLFRLSLLRAVVTDVPMASLYGEETSHLKIFRIIPEFLMKHTINLSKRIFYNYFLRNVSVASLELVVGSFFLAFGIGFGSYQWVSHMAAQTMASSGTVMLSAMPVLLGTQLLLSALSFDVQDVPRQAIHPVLPSSNN